MWVFPGTHHSMCYWLCKTTLITFRGKITTILLRKAQESFHEVLVPLRDHVMKFVERFLACVKTYFAVSLHTLMQKGHNLY